MEASDKEAASRNRGLGAGWGLVNDKCLPSEWGLKRSGRPVAALIAEKT